MLTLTLTNLSTINNLIRASIARSLDLARVYNFRNIESSHPTRTSQHYSVWSVVVVDVSYHKHIRCYYWFWFGFSTIFPNTINASITRSLSLSVVYNFRNIKSSHRTRISQHDIVWSVVVVDVPYRKHIRCYYWFWFVFSTIFPSTINASITRSLSLSVVYNFRNIKSSHRTRISQHASVWSVVVVDVHHHTHVFCYYWFCFYFRTILPTK